MSDTPAPFTPEDEPFTPPPAQLAIPADPVPGAYAVDYNDPASPLPDRAYGTGPLQVDPIPLIGAVSFGGIISNSESISLAPGQATVIGEKGRSLPRTTMIGLYSSDGSFGQTFQLLGDGQQDALGIGAFLPIGAGQPGIMWLPCRRVVVRNNSASTAALGVFVIQYDY